VTRGRFDAQRGPNGAYVIGNPEEVVGMDIPSRMDIYKSNHIFDQISVNKKRKW
jgi:hypothetical protein